MARKVVTIVFADLIGSTALHERLDAESTRGLMDRYYRALRTAVESHNGTVVKLLGDGVMAAFGVPHVAEDDAIRAVRAAVAVQQAFRALAGEQAAAMGPLGLRVGVNTGEVVVSAGNDDVVGDPVNVAARLQQDARPGEVIIGDATRRLVSELVTLQPVGVLSLKGRAETVAAYRVVSLERPAGAAAVAFVGRDDELRRLTAVYEAAMSEARTRLAVILGSPGLGKSRMLEEFARRHGDAVTVAARCESAGGATFAPLAGALRVFLRSRADEAQANASDASSIAAVLAATADRDRVADGIAAVLAGAPASPEETFFVVRRFLAALATTQPVVLAIDDLQWAEPLLLDLVEHLVQWGSGTRLLVLAGARPELRDLRSSLATPGVLVSDVVTLAGLDGSAATRMAASVIGAELPAAVAGRVLATSEGNPLFLGELVRMLVSDGVLKREGERWAVAVDLATLEMPPTIHALLAARIERLRPEDRAVLERAAVVGRQFSRSAVAHLLPPESRDLDARLEVLRRSELIEPDTTWFLGEPALRFHHGLTRDAAYRRLLKETRAELHGRLAEWITGKVGDAIEHDELLGWHLEQAYQHRRELGPIDAAVQAIGDKAAQHLGAAGRRALARDDVSVAADLLGRALHVLGATDPARADLALDWCEALLAGGDVTHAQAAIDELSRLASNTGAGGDGVEGGGSAEPFPPNRPRLSAWHTCFAGQLAALTDPQALRATAEAIAAAAEALAAVGDTAGEAKAHSVHALTLARLGRVGACEAALDRALAAARRAHDRRRSNAVLANAPLAALWGPSPVTRASGRCLDVVRVLRITQGAPAVEAVALRCQGVLEALRGRTEAARRMLASSRRMVEDLGITQRLLEADMFAGLVDLLEGDAAAAERSLRAAYDGLREHGLGIDAAQAAALLGRALLALDRAAEAETLSHESEALAGDDLRAAVAWRGVRAEAMARRGEHAAAVDFARAAVDIAAATDALLDHADARLALAAALRAAGRHTEAAAEEARAIELWEAKGATLLAERARREVRTAVREERAPVDRARPTPRRLVPPNAATVYAARIDAAIAARDAAALPALLRDDLRYVNNPTGTVHDREGMLASFRALLHARDGNIQHEPLATLGGSLAITRMIITGSAFAGARFDVAAYERREISVSEVDTSGRLQWSELFAEDRLGDAVARLYERYADRLPAGPERDCAAATARSVAALLTVTDLACLATAFDPAIEFVDHRPLGLPSQHGIEQHLEGLRSLREVSADVGKRIDDIHALQANAFLVRWTQFGTARLGGGPYERTFLCLYLFGPDGLATRNELFATDRDSEALARFAELVLSPVEGLADDRAIRAVRRNVLPNAMTAHAARLDTAMAARDAEALATLAAEQMEVIDHPTGTTYGREGNLASRRALLRADNLHFRHEPLATLGDSLALLHLSISASGVARGKFDVGAYEREVLVLADCDVDGRNGRSELFAVDRLGDAIRRLYERYAELLPDGPARERAAATARTMAATINQVDFDLMASAIAAEIEFIDRRSLIGLPSRRGASAFLDQYRTLFEIADDLAIRTDDILGARPDALLVRRTTVGTARAGGGPFERPFLNLFVYGSDGLILRMEMFDADREDEALARFEELAEPLPRPLSETETGETIPPSLVGKGARGLGFTRRLRPNAAIANARAVEAALAARDADAFETLIADNAREVSHRHGIELDRPEILRWWRTFLSAEDFTFAYEPLATLGESLALCRVSRSASGLVRGRFDVGPYEVENINVIEVDAQGRRRWTEYFADERLGDAVGRLYERYAEQLPEGAARTCVAATAGSAAAMVDPRDPARWAAALAPAVEFVDHRALGFPAARGAMQLMHTIGSLSEVASDVRLLDDIVSLQSNGLLIRRMQLGTARASGGAVEWPFLLLFVFGSDGLVKHYEVLSADRETEALARFDQLTGAPGASPLPATARRRRVRPNAATANAARTDAALAARDFDTLALIPADDCETIDHPTGTEYGRDSTLASWCSIEKASDATLRHEPLATLGDSLALFRLWFFATGTVGRKFDVGRYEREQLVVVEVDAQGRTMRSEIFAADHLGDAIARLYERYAERLPEGPSRERAAVTAGAAAFMLTPAAADTDRRTLFAPTYEDVDHRLAGHGALSREEATRLGAFRELADNVRYRIDDVLALCPSALVRTTTSTGVWRDGGGAFERTFCALTVFGPDGRVARHETFDAGHEAAALARFDESATAGAPVTRLARRVRPNAATANAARLHAAVGAGDADSFPTLLADDVEVIDRTTGVVYDKQGFLTTLSALRRARDPMFQSEVLATLGDDLALCRETFAASGFVGARFDVGTYEREIIRVIEVDAGGRHRRVEAFGSDRLGEAVARLYERYAELLPDGPSAEGSGPQAGAVRTRATATARSVAAYLGPVDFDRMAAAAAPTVEFIDHRTHGFPARRGAREFQDGLQTLFTTATDLVMNVDNVLELRPAAVVLRVTNSGTDRASGGPFERRYIQLWLFGDSGLVARSELFDADREAEALARFDELSPSPVDELTTRVASPRIENAVTRLRDRFAATWVARDWEGIAATFAPNFRLIDRRRYAHLELDLGQHLESLRFRFEMGHSRTTLEVIATRGNRLALIHQRFELAGGDVGPSETESLNVAECDDHGNFVRLVTFDSDDLDAAYAELDERYATGEAAPFTAVTTGARAFAAGVAARNWDAVAAVLAPDLVVYDHRPLGWEELHGPARLVDTWKSLVALAPDVRLRIDHITIAAHGSLAVLTILGTHEGGEFEDVRIVVHEYDGNGTIRRHDIYTLDQLDEARARFEEIGEHPPRLFGGKDQEHSPRATVADPLRIPPNAATRSVSRFFEADEAEDWDAVRALCTPKLVFDDRRRSILITGDRELYVASMQYIFARRRTRVARTLLATAGDRLALVRTLWMAAWDASPFEIETLNVWQVDAEGHIVADIVFDPDNRRAAALEMLERYSHSDDGRWMAHGVAFLRALITRDLGLLRVALPDDFVFHDHRRTGIGRLEGAQRYVEWIAALFEQSPDALIETLYYITVAEHGFVALGRTTGTLMSGGEFESVFVQLGMRQGDRILGAELFELDDLDRALARFAELRPEREPDT